MFAEDVVPTAFRGRLRAEIVDRRTCRKDAVAGKMQLSERCNLPETVRCEEAWFFRVF